MYPYSTSRSHSWAPLHHLQWYYYFLNCVPFWPHVHLFHCIQTAILQLDLCFEEVDKVVRCQIWKAGSDHCTFSLSYEQTHDVTEVIFMSIVAEGFGLHVIYHVSVKQHMKLLCRHNNSYNTYQRCGKGEVLANSRVVQSTLRNNTGIFFFLQRNILQHPV